MRCWASLALFSIGLAPRTLCAADSELAPAPVSASSEREEDTPPLSFNRSYAWQTLLVDGVSLATVLLGAAQSHPGYDQELSLGTWLAATGVGGYLVGGPIVHLSHRNVGRALGSLGLRGALPILLTFGGVPVPGHCPYAYGTDEPSKRTWCDPSYVGLWSLAVLGPAIAIDAALLAWEEVPTQPSARARTMPSLRIQPIWNWRNSAVGIGISGEL